VFSSAVDSDYYTDNKFHLPDGTGWTLQLVYNTPSMEFWWTGEQRRHDVVPTLDSTYRYHQTLTHTLTCLLVKWSHWEVCLIGWYVNMVSTYYWLMLFIFEIFVLVNTNAVLHYHMVATNTLPLSAYILSNSTTASNFLCLKACHQVGRCSRVHNYCC
jgi:hypothetical protein